jgi:hypothetical protein
MPSPEAIQAVRDNQNADAHFAATYELAMAVGSEGAQHIADGIITQMYDVKAKDAVLTEQITKENANVVAQSVVDKASADLARRQNRVVAKANIAVSLGNAKDSLVGTVKGLRRNGLAATALAAVVVSGVAANAANAFTGTPPAGTGAKSGELDKKGADKLQAEASTLDIQAATLNSKSASDADKQAAEQSIVDVAVEVAEAAGVDQVDKDKNGKSLADFLEKNLAAIDKDATTLSNTTASQNDKDTATKELTGFVENIKKIAAGESDSSKDKGDAPNMTAVSGAIEKIEAADKVINDKNATKAEKDTAEQNKAAAYVELIKAAKNVDTDTTPPADGETTTTSPDLKTAQKDSQTASDAVKTAGEKAKNTDPSDQAALASNYKEAAKTGSEAIAKQSALIKKLYAAAEAKAKTPEAKQALGDLQTDQKSVEDAAADVATAFAAADKLTVADYLADKAGTITKVTDLVDNMVTELDAQRVAVDKFVSGYQAEAKTDEAKKALEGLETAQQSLKTAMDVLDAAKEAADKTDPTDASQSHEATLAYRDLANSAVLAVVANQDALNELVKLAQSGGNDKKAQELEKVKAEAERLGHTVNQATEKSHTRTLKEFHALVERVQAHVMLFHNLTVSHEDDRASSLLSFDKDMANADVREAVLFSSVNSLQYRAEAWNRLHGRHVEAPIPKKVTPRDQLHYILDFLKGVKTEDATMTGIYRNGAISQVNGTRYATPTAFRNVRGTLFTNDDPRFKHAKLLVKKGGGSDASKHACINPEEFEGEIVVVTSPTPPAPAPRSNVRFTAPVPAGNTVTRPAPGGTNTVTRTRPAPSGRTVIHRPGSNTTITITTPPPVIHTREKSNTAPAAVGEPALSVGDGQETTRPHADTQVPATDQQTQQQEPAPIVTHDTTTTTEGGAAVGGNDAGTTGNADPAQSNGTAQPAQPINGNTTPGGAS